MSDRPHTGRYEVTAELGRGSMGVVHRAHDTVMNRDVAIKTILLPHGLAQPQHEEFQQRFRREAQAAGGLSHPGIVTVYDFDEGPETDHPFIAMEYVEGPTLDELIRRERLEPDWALFMGETLADALDLAHGAGIVHRDLKPANILIRESDGLPKITDFGVARVEISELTSPQTTYGSPAYAAPECIEGRPADARSDLFSLAVILYQTLSGERPFGGENFTSICHAIVNHEPRSIRDFVPNLSPAFDRWFARALDKDPDKRFQDGKSFAEALRALSQTQVEFDSGASTMTMSTPALPRTDGTVNFEMVESLVPLREAVDRHARAALIRRWSFILPPALVLILLGFAVGWGVRSSRPVDARIPGAVAGAGPDAATEVSVLPGATPATASLQDAATSDPTAELSAPTRSGGAEGGSPAPSATRSESTPSASLSAAAAPESDGASGTASGSPEGAVETAETVAPVDGTAGEGKLDETAAPADAETDAANAAAGFVGPVLATGPAFVDLRVRSSIKEGTLTVLADGVEVFATDLAAESGKFSLGFKKVLGKAAQDLETRIEIPSGARTLEAVLFNAVKKKEFRATLELDLEPGASQAVRVVTGRTFGRRIALKTE